MIKSQREKLFNRTSEFLSIGITVGGEPKKSVGVPWVSTVYAFNMKTPDVYLAPEDLQDEDLMKELEKCKVVGCYIWAPLQDYSFIGRFKKLRDLNIMNGDSIRDLSFISELYECIMLYFQNVKLKNLDLIFEVRKKSTEIFGGFRCIGLDNCEVEDVSVFEREHTRFSEFIVWMPEGSNQQDRWKNVHALTQRYFEFKE